MAHRRSYPQNAAKNHSDRFLSQALTAGGDYSYISYGHDRNAESSTEFGTAYSYSGVSSALSNGLKLHAGLAWQF